MAAALLGSAALLSGCATIGTSRGLDEALRRLLTISTQRAVARLVRDNGYLNDALARVTIPETPGDRSGAVLGALLRSRPVQDQLLRLVNDAAGEAADRAAPVIIDSIRALSFSDAVEIVRGGPTAGTDYLERAIGPRIINAMLPEVGESLRSFGSDGVLGPVIGAATGVNVVGLQRVVTTQAARGLWRAIGREESAIRADPRSARDPLIESVFAAGRLLG
ncbi:DUF4197 domain-containing protein [Sphingomonas citricola]|uniref:DUF4197 domain-containing protein n=1 Tax=Sphingomonas citricola TaxID=2862498 RepID=UPI001C671E6C|nr:DUF4197 domain-containing protein [Sphingomonas citricola]